MTTSTGLVDSLQGFCVNTVNDNAPGFLIHKAAESKYTVQPETGYLNSVELPFLIQVAWLMEDVFNVVYVGFADRYQLVRIEDDGPMVKASLHSVMRLILLLACCDFWLLQIQTNFPEIWTSLDL
jgi:hypothetical protein